MTRATSGLEPIGLQDPAKASALESTDLKQCIGQFLASGAVEHFPASATGMNGDLRRARQRASVRSRVALFMFWASATCEAVRSIAGDSNGALTLVERDGDVIIVSMGLKALRGCMQIDTG